MNKRLISVMICPLCNNALNVKIHDNFYDCGSCMAIVKDAGLHPSPEEEKKKYMEHNNDVNDLRYQQFTSPISNFILTHYTNQHEGLDFGSGTGPVISKVLHDNGYRIENYDPYFAPFDDLLLKQYDYIACCEVAEHFYEPGKEFGRLFNMMKPNGCLLIMTLLYGDNDLFSKWYYKDDPTHVFIYRKQTMEFIARKYGLSIEHMDDRLVVLRK